MAVLCLYIISQALHNCLLNKRMKEFIFSVEPLTWSYRMWKPCCPSWCCLLYPSKSGLSLIVFLSFINVAVILTDLVIYDDDPPSTQAPASWPPYLQSCIHSITAMMTLEVIITYLFHLWKQIHIAYYLTSLTFSLLIYLFPECWLFNYLSASKQWCFSSLIHWLSLIIFTSLFPNLAHTHSITSFNIVLNPGQTESCSGFMPQETTCFGILSWCFLILPSVLGSAKASKPI